MEETSQSLDQFIWLEKKGGAISDDIGHLIKQIAYASKIIARDVSRAAITGNLGLAGNENATGGSQKKLDVLSNQSLRETLRRTGLVSAIISEEVDKIDCIDANSRAAFVVCVDPLDGSSNIESGSMVGTIFGIYRRITQGECATAADVLRRGIELIAAGYVMYSVGTTLVFSTGQEVNAFTLDGAIGEFMLSRPKIRCPERGSYYSVNVGKQPEWSAHDQRFTQYLTEHDPGTGRPYSLRYSGALVADFHRILLEGGIYLYPGDQKHPNGKLRLLYECAPLAFIAESAGGRATNGRMRILEIKPGSIHQQEPIAIGSIEDVASYDHFMLGDMPSREKTNV